ncbi:hypothetical protein [Ralstonia insidiosa]|uniref:Uncharacterized protein n=1 Tax=Ralstonia insidiosa TaxID=190721 RepID=A0A848P3P1_9RALS|nr:hypothetical protein [Ralstonia insidiosa]NMV38258.1 hypothetical protein [Ralstonia insidiosa]
MEWLKKRIGEFLIMAEKMKIRAILKGLNPVESLLVDSMIEEGFSEADIVVQIRSVRLGARIEILKAMLKEAGFSEGHINDLVGKDIRDLRSGKNIEEIFEKIKSGNKP